MGVMDFTEVDAVVGKAIFDALPEWQLADSRLVGAQTVAFLKDHGWVVQRAEPLPNMAPARGPITSHAAAASIDDLSDRHYAICFALDILGSATDEELANSFENTRVQYHLEAGPQSDSSIRTRRKELARSGHVQWTGEYRPTKSGRKAMVWEASW